MCPYCKCGERMNPAGLVTSQPTAPGGRIMLSQLCAAPPAYIEPSLKTDHRLFRSSDPSPPGDDLFLRTCALLM